MTFKIRQVNPTDCKILIWDLENGYTLTINRDNIYVTSTGYRKHKKILSTYLHSSGYLAVKINNKHAFIHRLVAFCVLGVPIDNMMVNHIDGNKLNNSPDNLEYVTAKDNIRHAINMGLHVASDVTRMPTYKDGRTIGRRNEYKKEWRRKRKALIGSYT